MPYSTPNRVAYPAILENVGKLCEVVQDGGLYLPYYNRLSTSIMAGEVVLHNGQVCIARRTILPGKDGVIITDWVADVMVDPSLAAAIKSNDVVYWDYDIDAIVEGIGGATNVAPTNGFIMGRAVITPGFYTVSGGQAIACAVGQKRVRVAPVRTVTAIIGTLPQWSNTYA
jgi:predicted RecA/RadA family phage recombinase